MHFSILNGFLLMYVCKMYIKYIILYCCMTHAFLCFSMQKTMLFINLIATFVPVKNDVLGLKVQYVTIRLISDTIQVTKSPCRVQTTKTQ